MATSTTTDTNTTATTTTTIANIPNTTTIAAITLLMPPSLNHILAKPFHPITAARITDAD